MRLCLDTRLVVCAAILCATVLVGDSAAQAQNDEQARTSPTSSNAGLVLQESEGELRVRLSVGLRNTGAEPLSLVFIFPEPDGMAGQMRGGSVGVGEEAKPFTPEELSARNARASEHIVFDEPITP